MIFNAGSVSGKGYDNSRISRVEGITKVAAVSAVRGITQSTREPEKQASSEAKKEKFHDLLEQSKSMYQTMGNVLKATDEIKLAVLKQIISMTENMKEEYYKENGVGDGSFQPIEKICNQPSFKTQWTKNKVASIFYTNDILTAFQTNGYAMRTDGKNMTFDICLEMTDAFCKKYDFFTQPSQQITEPIVVYVDEHISEIARMRFLLDINANDEIKDTSNVYDTLKVWMKDVYGNSMLVDLQTLNVENAFQRKMNDIAGTIEKINGMSRILKSEVYDIPDERKQKKSNVDFSV